MHGMHSAVNTATTIPAFQIVSCLGYNRGLACNRTLDKAADQHGMTGIASTPQWHGTPVDASFTPQSCLHFSAPPHHDTHTISREGLMKRDSGQYSGRAVI